MFTSEVSEYPLLREELLDTLPGGWYPSDKSSFVFQQDRFEERENPLQ